MTEKCVWRSRTLTREKQVSLMNEQDEQRSISSTRSSRTNWSFKLQVMPVLSISLSLTHERSEGGWCCAHSTRFSWCLCLLLSCSCLFLCFCQTHSDSSRMHKKTSFFSWGKVHSLLCVPGRSRRYTGNEIIASALKLRRQKVRDAREKLLKNTYTNSHTREESLQVSDWRNCQDNPLSLSLDILLVFRDCNVTSIFPSFVQTLLFYFISPIHCFVHYYSIQDAKRVLFSSWYTLFLLFWEKWGETFECLCLFQFCSLDKWRDISFAFRWHWMKRKVMLMIK